MAASEKRDPGGVSYIHWDRRPVRGLPTTRDAWLTGAGSAMDLFGTSRLWGATGLYRWNTHSAQQADAVATYSDFAAVGCDFGRAFREIECDLKRPENSGQGMLFEPEEERAGR